MLEHNGGSAEPSDFPIYGETDNPDNGSTLQAFFGVNNRYYNPIEELRAYEGRVPSRLFPFASDAGGNLLCIATDGDDAGSVYFWDHEEESGGDEAPTYANVYFVASSFDDFLANLT